MSVRRGHRHRSDVPCLHHTDRHDRRVRIAAVTVRQIRSGTRSGDGIGDEPRPAVSYRRLVETKAITTRSRARRSVETGSFVVRIKSDGGGRRAGLRRSHPPRRQPEPRLDARCYEEGATRTHWRVMRVTAHGRGRGDRGLSISGSHWSCWACSGDRCVGGGWANTVPHARLERGQSRNGTHMALTKKQVAGAAWPPNSIRLIQVGKNDLERKNAVKQADETIEKRELIKCSGCSIVPV